MTRRPLTLGLTLPTYSVMVKTKVTQPVFILLPSCYALLNVYSHLGIETLLYEINPENDIGLHVYDREHILRLFGNWILEGETRTSHITIIHDT